MSITDPEASSHVEDDDAGDGDQTPLPNRRELWWPIVQALREMGRPASDEEITERVADSLSPTHQQRTVVIPSGRETRLKNRVGWAGLELKHIGVIHRPKPGLRELTTLGLEVNEARIHALRAEYEANKRRNQSAEEPPEGQEQADTPRAWLIRAGRDGDRFDHNIEHGLACLGWDDVPDLRGFSSRQELRDAVRLHYPDSGEGTISSFTSQLWRMRTDVRLGDLVVMPRKRVPEIALGSVTREYWYDEASDVAWGRHVVSVDWKRTEVPKAALNQDLQRSLGSQQTIFTIARDDALWRLQQLLETGEDPGPRSALHLPDLVERFRAETDYPTEAHLEQQRLRAEWAEKLAPENVASLTREDLAAYVSRSVDYGEGEYVKPSASVPGWILKLDDTQYDRLLDSIGDLCLGTDELAARIDRLVGESGASRRDTGTKGFAQGSLNATLAICNPDRFLPLVGHGGTWGFKSMLRKLGLPEPRGSTYGQQVVDANDRLREHLAPHLDDDPQAIGCFLYWLIGQETHGGGDEPDEASDLSSLVERFRAETGYRTEAHEEQERLRAEWAEKLASEHIESLSREDLTAFTNNAVNNGEYVRRVGGVMHWIRRLGEPAFNKLLDNIKYLCWGEDELSVRFDQLYLGDSPRKVKGYAGVNISRTLAICHPDSFLPVHRNAGNWGRNKMLSRLGLPAPRGNTPGQRVVDANNRLREHLEPHFGENTLEMGAFLRWLLELPDTPRPNGQIDLTELAAELLIDVDFLEDIVELLQDKGQVILYGPPGTGKTYLARELAKELARDDSCRALVQFHPSTSYEDFFEGYRPAGTGDDGNVRYELTPGPLARMAEQASVAPDQQHVMIIDEINRGNLPRVLGELLFLLEYRKESVQTLYRSEEPFELPENLWFIGTMNTADRSIALVDAALRRRFHFVPFFPDSGPMAGLLGRWLKAQQPPEPAWVGELVEAVNDELKKELGSSHLLLGPSHFMKEYGSSLDTQRRRLRRIWEYNIEPFIEDQFFGDPDRIAHFRFDAVMGRNGPAAESDVGASDDGDDPESTDGAESEHAAAEGDPGAEPGSTPEDER